MRLPVQVVEWGGIPAVRLWDNQHRWQMTLFDEPGPEPGQPVVIDCPDFDESLSRHDNIRRAIARHVESDRSSGQTDPTTADPRIPASMWEPFQLDDVLAPDLVVERRYRSVHLGVRLDPPLDDVSRFLDAGTPSAVQWITEADELTVNDADGLAGHQRFGHLQELVARYLIGAQSANTAMLSRRAELEEAIDQQLMAELAGSPFNLEQWIVVAQQLTRTESRTRLVEQITAKITADTEVEVLTALAETNLLRHARSRGIDSVLPGNVIDETIDLTGAHVKKVTDLTDYLLGRRAGRIKFGRAAIILPRRSGQQRSTYVRGDRRLLTRVVTASEPVRHADNWLTATRVDHLAPKLVLAQELQALAFLNPSAALERAAELGHEPTEEMGQMAGQAATSHRAGRILFDLLVEDVVGFDANTVGRYMQG